jgi:hypothetical protein
MPPLDLYARVRILLCSCTRDRGCGVHPAFPAPSFFKGERYMQASGASRREIVDSHPFERSEN